MNRIVFASDNPGKVREVAAVLLPTGLQVIPQSDFLVPAAEETGMSFVENAIIKARNACQHTRLPAIADDSGLEVDALEGEPGIYSARYAGPDASDENNNDLLLAELSGLPAAERSGRYQCVIVYMRHAADPTPLICQASWEGRILEQPRGRSGFGYDPLFWLPDQDCSVAELPEDLKNRLSHRGRALKALVQQLAATTG
ncbi:XTP/dITP diphosphohydrolase [Natronocella acetinitrilica]|uniref:dITP/XTP pyrophosphatase n=1 Tax=Natronocella acetinitrilica TaxID=414046 RepID=A0AAE3G6N4_9GAMM|nr:RdgB/HAM1 family non-canonical purine NTP pyrophosphatase [Natronocella acetinitrilica]MCP1675358.1 XTP/dITP diphosphohydrolase [Natronocella acetinitrilica]